MVAKSYQNFPTVGSPYQKGSRWYIKIQKGTTEKEVRWYTIPEYKKLYPNEIVRDPYYRSQKQIFGFDTSGFIYIFSGNTKENKLYFKSHNCLYTRLWGWGSPVMPPDLPADCSAHLLYWKDICANDESIGDDDKVYAVVRSILGDLPKEI